MYLGTNYHPVHGLRALDVKASNAQFCRFPIWKDHVLFCNNLLSLGIEPLIVLDKDSLNRWKTGSYFDNIRKLAARYYMVNYWQIGNEPDQPNSNSSWFMSHAEYNDLLRAARRALHGRVLIAAGLVSGNANWLNSIDLSQCDAIAVHPYGQMPDSWSDWGFGHARELINSYHKFNKPIWVTEFGGETDLFNDEHHRAEYHTEMIRTLADSGVVGAMQFCLTDRMVPGFGLLYVDGQPKESYAAFKDA